MTTSILNSNNSVSGKASNGYYTLSGSSSSGTTNSKQSSYSISQSVKASNASYLLSLSSDAQSYLNGSSSSTSSSSVNSKATYLLSSAQQKKITNIINQYKDEPYTQATFQKIQDALRKAGLSTDSLSAQDQSRSSSLASKLLAALNGTTSSDTSDTNATLAVKADNYITSIADQWKKVSTTATKS